MIFLKSITSYLQSIKYIYNLNTYSSNKNYDVKINDKTYLGLNNKPTNIKVFSNTKNENKDLLIIFPGASPTAENHDGLKMLGTTLANLGYSIFIPRIPPLKELKINNENIDWFIHFYKIFCKEIDSSNKKHILIGMSYGGAILINALANKYMPQSKIKCIMIYGAPYSLDTGLKFLIDGELKIKNKIKKIHPNSWGIVVLLYNFLNQTNVGFDADKIHEILSLRVKEMDYSKNLDDLNPFELKIISAALKGECIKEIREILDLILSKHRLEIEALSPQKFCGKINKKVFIFHGANDSMVPFTESILLSNNIKNSELLLSFIYEHKEIAENQSFFLKAKELLKMIYFFKKFFYFNEN